MSQSHTNKPLFNPRPCLLASCCYMPGIERWLESAREHIIDQVQPIIVMFKPYFEAPDGFTVIHQNCRYQHDLERYMHLPEILLRCGLDRWYIWTDFADVFFQAPLPDLGPIHQAPKAYVCPQDILHRDTEFWRPFLAIEGFQTLEDQPVYSLGTMVIQGRFFLDFINYLLMYKTFLRQHPLPVEQLFFNKWLYFQRNNIAVKEGLCVALYASYTGINLQTPPQPIQAFRVENRIVNSKGIPYSIVHANGPSRKFLNEMRPISKLLVDA